jgi:signal transduction histidine kinase
MSPQSSSQACAGSGVAPFLHDVIGPSLSSIGLQLEMLRLDYESDARLTARVAEVQASVETLMDQVRAFSNIVRAARPGDTAPREQS